MEKILKKYGRNIEFGGLEYGQRGTIPLLRLIRAKMQPLHFGHDYTKL